MLVEADFLREYGIDLSVSLPRMTWRRFLALVRGLSTNAASVTAATSRTEFGTREKVNTVEGPEAAQSAFVSLFGGGRKPPA